MPDSSFSTEKGLAGLKDFQRKTVDYVFERLYGRNNPTFRFLVADEVGLGKTHIARGIIAKTLEHLWKDIDRIDIVYVCSNAAIARQNINKLKIGDSHEFSVATRLTYLPSEVRRIREKKVNFISLTPGTAFDHSKSRGGHRRERAILYRMLFSLPLARKKRRRTGLLNLLQAKAGKVSWRTQARNLSAEGLDPDISKSFRKSVLADKELYEELKDCCERFSRYRDWKKIPSDDAKLRYHLIARLRSMLALNCMDALEPDLVILDEFQRFRHLLYGDNEASKLARTLFEYSDKKVVRHNVRVLLLSATPYKMFTLDLEKEEEDHYKDFIKTLEFLFNDSDRIKEVENLITEHRRTLYSGGLSNSSTNHKKNLENTLRSVMCRTERVVATSDKDSMLEEKQSTAPLKSSDLEDASMVNKIAACLDAGEHIEYWKSAPYLINFLKNYKIRRKLDDRMNDPSKELLDAFSKARNPLLTERNFHGKKRLDPANPRMRVLFEDTVEKGMWQLLWMPPSMPYSKPEGVFSGKEDLTKSLVFSSWNAVPNAIASVCSNEAERRMISKASVSPEDLYGKIRPLLRFSTSAWDRRLTGMPVVAWMLPSPVLATEVDPLMISLRHGDSFLSTRMLKNEAKEVCRRLLERMSVSRTGSRVDRRWYWAAPALLNSQNGFLEWCRSEFGRKGEADTPDREYDGTGFSEHVDSLVEVIEGKEELGRQPEDLADVLSELALAGPGVCALRSFYRVAGDEMDAFDHDLLSAAALVAWGFRSLFNMPETIAMLRGHGENSYWRSTLRYGIDGNLQSVLDEYVHVLNEDMGLQDHEPADRVREIAERIQSVLSLRTAQISIDEIKRRGGKLSVKPFNTRSRFALRFGDVKGDDDKTLRPSSVRDAFNSPFKPFVLASTSIGQEGLDFHQWCHAVVHWNLPSNPVDLEQREGRVHRYKGHAIRKNIAEKYGLRALQGFDGGDPWQKLFEKASNEKPPGQSDLIPYWIFEGSARVERRIPLLPYSREVKKLKGLKDSLALYRAVFGQPRQEDLINILKKSGSSSDGIDELLISLSPPEQTERKTIVIATRNGGKLKEFKAILGDTYDEILSLSDFGNFPEVEETGSSFKQNAFIKAKAACDFLEADAIADDSGLVVEALGGAPGIYSARYAGQNASDHENNEKLLLELEGKENRDARFVCCIALVLKDGTRKSFEGECRGQIISERRGTSGFGYDPVFYVPQYGKTMAELGPEIKNRISHRAMACGKLLLYFSGLT